MSIDSREARLERRIADLYADDEQFAAAKPDDAVSEAAGQPDLRLPDVVRTVMDGYADRPALGQRAVEFVTDAAGRTVAELLPRFDTVTYGELWERVQALAAALRERPGRRRRPRRHPRLHQRRLHRRRHGAAPQLGAVSVPLQTSAPAAQLQPIVAETEPVVDRRRASTTSTTPSSSILAGPHARTAWSCSTTSPQVDDQREALDAAKARLAGTARRRRDPRPTCSPAARTLHAPPRRRPRRTTTRSRC